MRRMGLFGAVLVALAIVYLIAWEMRPGPIASAGAVGQTAAVTSVTRSCPPAAPGTGASRITMIAMPSRSSAEQSGAPGVATLSEVPAATTIESGNQPAAKSGARGTKKPVTTKAAVKAATTKPAAGHAGATAAPVTVSAPGTAAMVAAPGAATAAGARAGAAVAATGHMASGFEAEQANAAGTGLVSCTHPSSDMWFVGTGQGAGAGAIWLYLMNTGEITASADVTILTDTGQQSGLSNAISVAPDQVVAENITPYVLGSQALALHVQTTSGQVAGSVWEGNRGGAGAWLPQAAAPAMTQVIPGLTVANSPPRLFVVVPGATDARLKVVAYTQAGMVPLFTSSPVDASAGATTPVTLTALGGSAAGLQLTSTVPFVAGVQVSGRGIGSFTSAVPDIAQQGLVAGNPATRGVTVGLLLTAPSAAAQASISVVSADGTVTAPAGGQSVTVKAGHTLAVAVARPPGSRAPFAIVITPADGSGPIYAARLVTSGSGGLSAPAAALLPVSSALTEITLPPVSNSYSAVLP
jgi:hypothetical protein